MWKSAYVGVYQLLNWKMHGETLKDAVSFSDISLCVRKESDSIGWMTVSTESGFA